jgi:hypothetical protein
MQVRRQGWHGEEKQDGEDSRPNPGPAPWQRAIAQAGERAPPMCRRRGKQAEQPKGCHDRKRRRASITFVCNCASGSAGFEHRSALELLLEMGISPEAWCKCRHLMDDPGAKIAALACKLGLTAPQAADQETALARLRYLLEHADWMLAENIGSFLAEHFCKIAEPIGKMLEEQAQNERARLALRRIMPLAGQNAHRGDTAEGSAGQD